VNFVDRSPKRENGNKLKQQQKRTQSQHNYSEKPNTAGNISEMP